MQQFAGQSGHYNQIMVGQSYSAIMMDRFHKANVILPAIDQRDILEENPNFNNGKTSGPVHQH